MRISNKRAAALLIGLTWTLATGLPAFADDTELFFVDPSNIQAKPNILFILDNSGSMEDLVESQGPYSAATTYPAVGSCGTGRIYWVTSTNNNPAIPDCASDNWFNKTAFVCKAALDQFATGAERFRTYFMQYDDSVSTANRKWLALSSAQKSRRVECKDDRGVHSDGVAAGKYARNGNASPWGPAGNEISWTNTRTWVFDGNYLNWYYGPTGPEPKIKIVKAVATNILSSINGVNAGLMIYNDDQGGNVQFALTDIDTARANITQAINNVAIQRYTPLSETLYEAALYYKGEKLKYGNVGPLVSVDASRIAAGSDTYRTPLEEGCQKNFIIYLSDGLPTEDHDADADIQSLIGGTCDGNSADDGYCLDDLAGYLAQKDISSINGDQHVITYTIGFDADVPVLKETARKGGGAYFQANDSASLTTALTSILYEILSESSTFTAPAVAVNSFNRTRNLNDLYISVFTATGTAHWPGNLKKYELDPATGTILDANGTPAVDASGFFADGTRSMWSATVDGPSVPAGGAASNIPAPANRKVYTYLGGQKDLTNSSNAVASANGSLTDVTLNTGGAGRPTRDDIIKYMRGQDPVTGSTLHQMGDPLHAQSASVTYGSGTDDTAIYFVTNDGYLHSINANNGVENWAFIPPEFLDDQVDLYLNEPADTRHYGIDGSPRIQMVADNDGTIEPGEKVYLFFGMRRGGDFYYGLDVTNPNAPKVLWRLSGTGTQTLNGNGQSWSNPVPARMDIASPPVAQNPDKLVLVFGAGYDPKHDNYNLSGTDATGNGIFVVDSVKGDVLWHGAPSGGDKAFAQMNYSIPGDVKVVDLNADGFADRMYAADMGGQVWRFDIFNGQSPSNLVNGGVIAQLGGAPAASPPLASTRRFYYSPDVALVSADTPFIHIGVGSGHRARPNGVFNQDRFYALRDYATFRQLTQAEYNAITPTSDAELEDITNDVNHVMPPGSKGWKLNLVHTGEKVLAEARTFNNQVFFTSFEPGAGAGGNTTNCKPALGTNRLYTVSLFNGAPVNNLDGPIDGSPLTEADRYREFEGSLPSEVVFIFPSPDDPTNCVGNQCTPPPVACVDLFCFAPGFANDPIRTFWSQQSVD